MARKSDGTSTNPKQIRTDVDCRAARPKFNNGAWSAAKISDVTGGGLYLFVTPEDLLHRPLRQRQGWHVLARERAA